MWLLPYLNLNPQANSMIKDYLLGCDWGTTSFRLRVIRCSDRSVVGEVLSSEGIASLYTAWQAAGMAGVDRQTFFIQRLKRHIDELAQQTQVPLAGIQVLISGMASSTIGICEVPYAHVPFELDGSQILTQRLEATADFPHEILLISGVRSEHDVMRGEETQLVGLSELVGRTATQNAIFIFPGTHSKHLHVRQHCLVQIHTFMTGELFGLLAEHSILKASIQTSNAPHNRELEAFRTGVRESKATGILKNLFRVRTNQLFQKLTTLQNSFFLSGLLIGSELTYLAEEADQPLILNSSTHLYELYHTALQELNLTDRLMNVSASTIDQATVVGQIKIFQNQALTLNSTLL
jgi:2-dehydro-3-deoxygalactonokinase